MTTSPENNPTPRDSRDENAPAEPRTPPASEKDSPGAPAPEGFELEENFVESFSENILHSFVGEKKLPEGKKTSTRFWLGCLRLFYRLFTPTANQVPFEIAFWVARGIGSVVLASWLYFGFRYAVWDSSKLVGGIGFVLFGPLIVRAIEFVLENIVLKGSTKECWHNFWNFKRMMTPRSIQTAFFLGFWFLVVSGMVFVFSGFYDLLVRERAGSIQDAFTSVLRDLDDANILAQDLLRSDNVVAKVIRDKMNPATIKEMEEAGQSQPLPEALREKVAREAADIIQKDQTILRMDPSDLRRFLPGKWIETFESRSNPFAKILKGLLLMVLGPMVLRLTAEPIILFFRVNETLSDISKHLEIANKRAEDEKTPPEKHPPGKTG